MKLKDASGKLCDCRILMKAKGKFYRIGIRPIMLCRSEC